MTQAEDSHQSEKTADGDIIECQPRERTPSPESQPTPRNWGKTCIAASLMYVVFWISASISLQAPFFPREAESKGATPTQYGFIMGVFELVAVIMSPVFGRLMPRVSPKLLIIIGSLIGGASCLGFGALDKVPAGNTYIAMAFIVRIFDGFGAAAAMTACFTIIASSFPDTVATSFSLVETTFGIGLIIGPTIGGGLYQVGGFILPFAVNGVLLLLGSILLGFVLPTSEEGDRQIGSRNLLGFLLDGDVITYTLSIITSLLFMGFNSATLEPHIRKFNLSPVVLAMIFVVNGIAYAITTPIWGRICDKGVNPLMITLFGYIITSIGILLIGPVTFIPFKSSLATIIVSLLVLGLGLSAKVVSSFTGTLKSTIARGFPDNLATHGMVSALFSTACSAGAFIGPSLGGVLLDSLGYRKASFVIFVIEIFFMVLLVMHAVGKSISRGRNVPKDTSERDPLLPQPHSQELYSHSFIYNELNSSEKMPTVY